MLWIKAFHLIAMTAWFAGLFYLPRLFLYHTLASDKTSQELFKVMEWRLYRIIMNPAAITTILLGIGLLWIGGWQQYHSSGWLTLKLVLVLLLVGYHHYCKKIMLDFKKNQNKHSVTFYRWFNEIPTVILISVVLLAVLKPF